MNLALKNVLTITAKNAVNAVLVSGVMKVLFTGNFQFSSRKDWLQFGAALLNTVAVRETMVWVPILLKWSVTSANPAAERTAEGGLVVPPPKP